MESRLIIFVFSLICGFAYAQPTAFYKVYSGNGYDVANGLTQLPDSSYLLTGSSSSFDDAPSQAFLMQLDKLGNYMWSRPYGGTEFEEGKRVFSVENFGHYVIGTSSSGSSHNFDLYLFQTDLTGNMVWEQRYDYGSWERINNATMLADTSIVAIAETDSTNDGNKDFYMLRFDKIGGIVWSKKWGSSGDDVLKGIVQVTDTTFAICGSVYVEDSLTNKAYIGYFHNDGTTYWEKYYCDLGYGQLNDILYDFGSIKAIGQRKLTETSDWEYFNMTTDLDGVQNVNQYFTTGTGSGRYTAMTRYTANPNNYFVVTQVADPLFPTFPDGEDNLCARYNAAFYYDNVAQGYNNQGQDDVNHIIPTLDGFAVFVGSHEAYCCGGMSLFIVKIGSESVFPSGVTNPTVFDMVSLKELNELINVKAYPNPFNDALTIELPENVKANIFVYDQLGKKIEEIANCTGTVDFTTNQYSNGFYIFRIESEEGVATLKLVK